MTKKVKKGTKGTSAQYITRARALKKTQLRLAEFRRMCILKGIYPREPKRKLRGPSATYYHVKDIASLNRDELMPKFRQEKSHEKKIKKAKGRNELSLARRYVTTKPTYTLSHIVKERYPTLVDAVADLDDPLSTLALFAALPADDKNGISQNRLSECIQFLDQFHYLVAQKSLLKKVFASVKGFYFQAEILGKTVTWLVPHNYSQELPYEVDFRVMNTFQELYLTTVKFVNFKLYEVFSTPYPPTVDERKKRSGARHLALHTEEVKDDDTAETAEHEDVDMTGDSPKKASNVPTSLLQSEEQRKLSTLFQDLTVFVSREVPLGPLSLVLLSGGATIGWDSEESPISMEDPDITHQIIDRPRDQVVAASSDLAPRTYVQPQWVLDCLNNDFLLPCEPYGPGCQAPPHLSPFVDDEKEGYFPKQREVLNRLVNKKNAKGANGTKSNDDVDDEDDEGIVPGDNIATAVQYQQEIDGENSGVWYSSLQEQSTELAAKADRAELAQQLFAGEKAAVSSKRITRKKKREEEEVARRMAVMSNRKRKLKEQLDEGKRVSQRKAQQLMEKRTKLQN